MKKTIGILLISSSLLANQDFKLDNLIVTAQKQSEKDFDVPISLSVIDEYTIEDMGLKDFKNLSSFTSGLSIIDYNGGTMGTSIRGISTDTSIESSTVGIYVDGVPYLGTVGNNIVLEDIERIEVLKGPQGTLYGKNAYGGVINIISKKPNNETKAKVSLELGEDSKKELSFNTSGALKKDKFFVGLTGKFHKKDGFIKNTYTNTIHDDREQKFLKSYLRYIINNKMEVSLISSFLENDDGGARLNLQSAPDHLIISQDGENYLTQDTKAHTLKFDYNGDDFKLSSLITLKDQESGMGNDNDYSPAPLMQFYSDIKTDEKSFETKLIKDFGKLNVLAGVYLDDLKTDKLVTISGIPFQNFDVNSKSLGLFLNAKYPLTQKLSVQVGTRFDKDKINLKYKDTNEEKETKYNSFSPKLSLNYKFSDNFSTYGVISKGYKSGGYYLFAPRGEEDYEKETLINYELGMKSLINENLKINASVYFMDIKDKQVAQKDVLTRIQYMRNAGKAQSKGIDFEATYSLNSNLTLFTTLGLNETKFTEYQDSLGNYKDNYNPFSPKTTYSIGATFRADNGIFANLLVKGQSEIYSDRENLSKSDGFSTADLKLGYETDNFEIYLYSNNMTNKIQKTYYGAGVFVSEPRETGIKLTYRF